MCSSLKWLIRPEIGVVLALIIGVQLMFNPVEIDKAVITPTEQTNDVKIEPKIHIEDDASIMWFLESSHTQVWQTEINRDFAYSNEELQVMAEYWPSAYPIVDNFNDGSIRDRIRENVLKICDKLLALAEVARNLSDPRRIEDIKHIRNLYANETIWRNRPIPKYYHSTKRAFFDIMNTTYIKCIKDRHMNPAAWFASGFFESMFVFSFPSNLERPIEDLISSCHYLNGSRNDAYCIGRKSDIFFYNSSTTTLVSWAVPHNFWNRAISFIEKSLPKDLAEFYLSRGQTNIQMILERQMISLAQIYTTDRANSAMTGTLRVKLDTIPLNRQALSELRPGELLICRGQRYSIFSHMAPAKQLSMIITVPAFRKFSTAKMTLFDCQRTMHYIPDINMDAMQFMQVLADGRLLSDPVDEYKAFNFTIDYEWNPKLDDPPDTT